MKNLLWGFDLGGTKIEGVVLDADHDYQVIARERVPTEQSEGYHHIMDQISNLKQQLEKIAGASCTSLGIGTPGAIDRKTQVIKNSNTTVLNGMPFRDDLSELLGIKISMANDANCFALAETRMGAIKDHCPDAESVFGVILGTGVGGGLVVDNKIMNGLHGIGGEWGHNFLHESGGPCYCSKIGCVETIIAGPALEKFYHAKSVEPLTLSNIYKAHLQGNDPVASETINRLIHYFGYAISWIINIIDPDAIVIGGGVGNIDILYSQGVESALPHVFNPQINTKILPPKLGDSAGVFGAAFLSQE